MEGEFDVSLLPCSCSCCHAFPQPDRPRIDRTYEEAEAHARAQGEESKKLVTKIQAFSLAHRGDLLEDCPEVDIDEMQQEVIRLLEELTGTLFVSRPSLAWLP